MPTPVPTYLKNHEAVVAAFGEWPGFHDAPVLAVRYSERQGGRVEIDLHGFWVTGEVGEGGYLKLTSHHLVRFAFTGITDADLTGSTNGNVLFDLGFFKYGFFAKILEYGGHFISRLRDDANPVIVGVNRLHRGRAIDLVGKSLKEIRESLKRQEVDAVVEVEFRRRGYAGAKGRLDRMTLRLVGIKDSLSDDYHFYLTDLPPDTLTAEQVADLYRGRWFIEMLFKELKSRYALDVIIT